MEKEFLKSINLKKIGSIGMIVSIAIITYYTLSSYKVFLEIKEIKKDKNA